MTGLRTSGANLREIGLAMACRERWIRACGECRHLHGTGSNRAGFESMTSQSITPALFDFLRDLEASNERQWFEANRERYRTEVRDPVLDFIVAFAQPLKKISPHFLADPRGQWWFAVPDLSR